MLRFHSLRIDDIRPDAQDAVAISLDVPAGLRAEYSGRPGQHIVVRAALADELDARRTYSLVNAPGEWPLRIVVRIHPHGRMSRHLATNVRVGQMLEVLPPNGSLTPRAQPGSSRTYVAFASGCGITPILSIARAQLGDGHRMIVFYGNTTTDRAMCTEELLALKDRCIDRLALHFIMSREPQDVALYNGRIDAARVRELAAQKLFPCAEVADYFVCGPGNMIEQVSATLRELGVEGARIHGEHFTSAETVPPATATAQSHPAMPPAGAARASPATDTAQVAVVMDGRRRTFTMRMHTQTVLDAAADAGLDLPFSCRAGVCSTCRTKVISGAVAMEQNYALEDWELEQGYILACQARVTTPVLELDYDEK